MALQITITDAGRAEIINAQNTGTDPVVIAEIGLGTGQYVPAESQTALVAEFKRLTTFGGSVVAADTISIAIRDDSADVYEVSEFGLYTASGTLLAVYSVVGTPFFDKAAQSILLLAVDIKLTTLDAAALTFGDINFVNPPATETVMGVAELATAAEVQAGTDTERIVTPAGLSSRTATATRTGLVELATDAEGQTGTDTARAVTPAVMRADSTTANTANRVVRRGAAGEIAVGAITASGNISGVNGTFTGPVSVQNLTYSGSLTGSAGVLNIGSGQIYKTAGGSVGFGTESPTSRVTIGSGAFSAAASGTSGLYTAASGLLTILADGLDISTRGGSGRFTLNTAGNAGLGVTPSVSWGTNQRVFDIAGVSEAHVVAQVNSLSVGTNYLLNSGGTPVYQNNGFATRNQFSFGDGGTRWFTAPSGTAGNPITFTQAMTLTQSGALVIGGSGADGDRLTLTTSNEAGLGAPVFSTVNANAGARQLSIFHAGSTLGIVNARSGGALVLGADNAEKARITSAGNLLVGTTNDAGYRVAAKNISAGVLGVSNNEHGLTIAPCTAGTNVFNIFSDAGSLRFTSGDSKDQAANFEFARFSSATNLLLATTVDDGVHKLQVNGLASAQTPAQFDNDTSLATSAFVQRALGNYSDVRILTANTVLTAADAGKYIFINASSISVTLPNPATLPLGATFTIVQSVTTFGAQIVAPGGVTMNGVMTGSTSSPIVMQNKAEYEIVAVTGAAYQVAMFGGTASLAASGYQFLPSGLIMQWGVINNSSSGSTVTFPISFPTLCFGVHLVMNATGTPAGEFNPQYSALTNSSVFIQNGRGSTVPTFWTAIGY